MSRFFFYLLAICTMAVACHAANPLIDEHWTHVIGAHWQVGHPCDQLIVHHFCRNDTSARRIECALFDSGDADGKLLGIEWLIPRDAFAALPREERALWHSHVHEIKSGLLAFLGNLSLAEQRAAATELANAYGKIFQLPRGEHAGAAIVALTSALENDTGSEEQSARAHGHRSHHGRHSPFAALRERVHHRRHRHRHGDSSGDNATASARDLPVGIPQLFTSFTDQGPKMHKRLVRQIDALTNTTAAQRRKSRENLTVELPILPGADAWQTGRAIQVSARLLQLQNGTAVEEPARAGSNETTRASSP
jgi:hypothetical protein